LANNMAPHFYKEKRRHVFANGIDVEIDGNFWTHIHNKPMVATFELHI